jgi:hypothetical protein
LLLHVHELVVELREQKGATMKRAGSDKAVWGATSAEKLIVLGLAIGEAR